MAYINGQVQKLTESEIKTLESVGFKRWTKGRLDRLYINPAQLGLETDRYKTGNISHVTWKGEKVSNSLGAKLAQAKTYIDVVDGEVSSDSDMLERAALELAELSLVREEA